MSFRVYDCLSDIELAIKPTRKEAEEISAIHGGADNCIHVFEVEKVAEIKEKKPSKVEFFS